MSTKSRVSHTAEAMYLAFQLLVSLEEAKEDDSYGREDPVDDDRRPRAPHGGLRLLTTQSETVATEKCFALAQNATKRPSRS